MMGKAALKRGGFFVCCALLSLLLYGRKPGAGLRGRVFLIQQI